VFSTMDNEAETSGNNLEVTSNESRKRKVSSNSEGDDVEEEEESSEDEYDPFDNPVVVGTSFPEHENLKADVREAAKKWNEMEKEMGISSVEITPSICGLQEMCSVVMTLNVSNLPELIRRLWELGTAITVSVIVDGVHKEEFRKFEKLPTVLARIDTDKASKFPVGECLINLVKWVVTNTYSLEENLTPSEVGSFFSMVYEHLVERMRTLTEYCMVCGAKLYAGGLLPSICGGRTMPIPVSGARSVGGTDYSPCLCPCSLPPPHGIQCSCKQS
ncbi:hypothetical protein PMAYCL1PPCAC_29787, partial [Pristionchus mayeri]